MHRQTDRPCYNGNNMTRLGAVGLSHAVTGSMELPDFFLDPTSSTDCFRRLLETYLLHDTSASSALSK